MDNNPLLTMRLNRLQQNRGEMIFMTLKEKMAEKQSGATEIVGDQIEYFGTEENPETGEEIDKWGWQPYKAGDKIEGLVIGTLPGQYGEQLLIAIEDGRQVTLPAHADLKKKIKQVFQFDYIWVELDRLIPSNNPDYNDKPMYKLTVVPSDEVPDEYKKEFMEGLE